MTMHSAVGTPDFAGSWLDDPAHLAWLDRDAARQLDFFRGSLRADGGFDVLDLDGTPLPRGAQELHTTTRMVHSYALARSFGHDGTDDIIDAGMAHLWSEHRDSRHGGYLWSVEDGAVADGTKLAYGHVFVLLAASSALKIGHPEARRLLDDIAQVIDRHYWDEARGLLRDEFNRDWTPFSTYRGMNANMHGVEAMLTAFEATQDAIWLDRAERILDFFVHEIAPAHDWRLPEHYTREWQVDPEYSGNPMFRPAGSTPGHSLELGRLLLQHWDLCGRPDTGAERATRHLVSRALADAWAPQGGMIYTLALDGTAAISDRYWWPVTEAIGVMAAFLKSVPASGDEAWYRKLWQFADATFVDHDSGGWYPEIDAAGRPVARQFEGKPDIYHSLQAVLLPRAKGISGI